MDAKMKFFIYLLEHYAEHNDTTADKVLEKFDAAGITDTVYEMYQQYHSEAIENAYDDIDSLLLESASN